jgi:hypothetical protein
MKCRFAAMKLRASAQMKQRGGAANEVPLRGNEVARERANEEEKTKLPPAGGSVGTIERRSSGP